jgi:sugar phosphate isomerase/epimerase
MARMSISSWSLHHSLGKAFDVLELPETIAGMGINTLEICHFHLPKTDDAYLSEFRAACEDAEVELFSVLIDQGDISAPDAANHREQMDFTTKWLEITSTLGATHARVAAGDSEPSAEAISRSATSLRVLAKIGTGLNVQVITENWKKLTRRAAPLVEILDRCDGTVGVCADFGNFSGPEKYSDLKAIAARSTSCHAKAQWPLKTDFDRSDFEQCLTIMRAANFDGPYSVIYDSGGDESAGIRRTAAAIEPFLNANAV